MRLSRRHLVVASIIAGMGGVVYVSQHTKPIAPTKPIPQAQSQKVGPSEIYPNPSKTPGFLNPDIEQGNIAQNICNPHWSTKFIRPVTSYTTNLKKKQLAGGYAYHESINPADYEEDHFVSLELGGSPADERNLWPEPYNVSLPDGGAKSKDKVENFLHEQVCDGEITLQEAQNEITTDWYKVFKENHL